MRTAPRSGLRGQSLNPPENRPAPLTTRYERLPAARQQRARHGVIGVMYPTHVTGGCMYRTTKLQLLIAVPLATLALSALAQDATRPADPQAMPFQRMLEKMDTNGD